MKVKFNTRGLSRSKWNIIKKSDFKTLHDFFPDLHEPSEAINFFGDVTPPSANLDGFIVAAAEIQVQLASWKNALGWVRQPWGNGLQDLAVWGRQIICFLLYFQEEVRNFCCRMLNDPIQVHFVKLVELLALDFMYLDIGVEYSFLAG